MLKKQVGIPHQTDHPHVFYLFELFALLHPFDEHDTNYILH